MNPSFLYTANKDLKDRSGNRASAINDPLLNMNEGSEFLDDSLRMKDLPFMFSDEKIDSGRSWNLL